MKNIVLTTGYSLLTAFFLCTPPLCAQEKVLDRMTRSEARQETLRHTEIKDHVTFYHSNDKDIYVVYDLISSGNKEKMLQGKTILLGILDAFESTRNQSRPLEVSFFAREKFFDSIRILKENKLMDAELRQLSESLVSQMSFCEERGPNNRAANYAMEPWQLPDCFRNTKMPNYGKLMPKPYGMTGMNRETVMNLRMWPIIFPA